MEEMTSLVKSLWTRKEQLVGSMTEMLEKEVLCDVTVVVDDVAVPCHKLVLAASSPYFRYVFRL